MHMFRRGFERADRGEDKVLLRLDGEHCTVVERPRMGDDGFEWAVVVFADETQVEVRADELWPADHAYVESFNRRVADELAARFGR